MTIRLVTLSLSLFVTACGGGGANPGSPAAPEGAQTSAPPVALKEAPVFAAPSGPLCAQRTDGICVEPTSSSVSPQQLLAALTDPQGHQMAFTRDGHLTVIHAQTRQSLQSGTIFTEGAYRYDSTRKVMVAGRNRIGIDGRNYDFDQALADGTLEFGNGANDRISLRPSSAQAVSMASLMQREGESRVEGVPAVDLRFTVDKREWQSHFGLLTDSADANAPAGQLLRYEGSIRFTGGDGTPFPASSFLRVVAASCPASLTFDTGSGKVTMTAVRCEDQGVLLDFSLQGMVVRESRIVAGPDARAAGTVSGPVQGGSETLAAPAASVAFTADRIGGAVYDSGARHLMIHGSGPLGVFTVAAARQ